MPRKEINRYAQLFGPTPECSPNSCWLQTIHDLDTKEKRKEWRLTALCFFAAMLEDEAKTQARKKK